MRYAPMLVFISIWHICGNNSNSFKVLFNSKILNLFNIYLTFIQYTVLLLTGIGILMDFFSKLEFLISPEVMLSISLQAALVWRLFQSSEIAKALEKKDLTPITSYTPLQVVLSYGLVGLVSTEDLNSTPMVVLAWLVCVL